MKLTRPLVLASASPRRREILEQLGLVFTVQPANVDESLLPGEDHDRYVVRLAAHKAHAAAALFTDQGPRCVLGADTTVVLEGKVFGKPENREESEQILRELRGREHIVYTGVALWLVPEAHGHSLVVNTRVLFRNFSDETLRRYVDSGEGLDKAGSYGIQDLGAGLVSELHGSYSNVVGLPAAETLELLESAGILAEWP